MPTLLSWLVLLLSAPTFTSPSPVPRSAVRVNFVGQLEQAAVRGEISAAELLRLRRLAVTAPDQLPRAWRARLDAAPLPSAVGTALLVENFQWSRRMGLRDDTQFPPVTMYLDSLTFPLRVGYALESDLELAQAVLVAAENAWQKEILEWGFYAPPIVTSEARYRIYVDDTGMGGGGYMSPVDFHADTPWDDCTSYIVIDRLNNTGDAGPVVAHELSHATQGAMDCLETITFWENTSTFIMAEVDPVGRAWQDGFLAYFQDYPQESVSGGSYEDPELGYFWYGGFLWPNFLGGLYGGAEAPAVLVRRIWEGAMQQSGGYSNDISYMTSVDDVLSARADASLDEAFLHFTVSRFLVGINSMAPGADMPHAAEYTSIPPIEADLVVDRPATFTPTVAAQPEPYAVNYLTLSRPGVFSREVTVRLSTSDTADWAAVLFSTAKSVEVLQAPLVDGEAVLRFTMGEERSRVLAVVRLGTTGFHSDDSMTGASYTVDVSPTYPAPEVLSVEPSTIRAGKTSTVTIHGRYFVEGATVQVSPYYFETDSVEFVDAQTLRVTFSPGAELPALQMDVYVINPDTGGGSLGAALWIEPVPPPPNSCSTRRNTSSSIHLGFWLLVAGLFWLRRSRI